MKTKSKIKVVIIILLLFIIGYILYTAISICMFANKDQTQEADAAIVLGAGINDNAPSEVFKERINHAILLYKDGYIKKIIFTGGISEGNQISDAEVAKIYAMEHGILEEDIFIENHSTITQENLFYAKEIMKTNNFETALIVSDPLHMKRAMIIAKAYNITAYASPTQTSRYVTVKTKFPFLMREVFYYILFNVYNIFT